jgi:hypothetical protein
MIWIILVLATFSLGAYLACGNEDRYNPGDESLARKYYDSIGLDWDRRVEIFPGVRYIPEKKDWR